MPAHCAPALFSWKHKLIFGQRVSWHAKVNKKEKVLQAFKSLIVWKLQLVQLEVSFPSFNPIVLDSFSWIYRFVREYFIWTMLIIFQSQQVVNPLIFLLRLSNRRVSGSRKHSLCSRLLSLLLLSFQSFPGPRPPPGSLNIPSFAFLLHISSLSPFSFYLNPSQITLHH